MPSAAAPEATHADAVRAGEPLPGWVECQRREQERMLGTSLSEKWVYFGVRVATSRRYQKPAAKSLN